MEVIEVNNSKIFYIKDWEHSNLNEYYNFILNKLKNYLSVNNINTNINFGNRNFKSDINVYFQYEHTIINETNGYSCVINDYNYLSSIDFVFEYCNSNITHIKKTNAYNEYVNKLIYFPPLIYNLTDSKKRYKDCLTIHNSTPRRNKIHQLVNMQYYHHECGSDMFSKENMKKIMDEYKILVNIHQTDTHHTLEELRVLPALLTGIIVISEEVPYKESIPYSKHIIWSKYDDIPKKISSVLSKYKYYQKKYLTGISDTIKLMEVELDKNLNSMFNKIK
jgi:hypothetical protein